MQLMTKWFHELTVDELYDLLQLRTAVFVAEQQCPYQELDGKDRAALHTWLQDANGVVAYLRVLPAGLQGNMVAIGRVVTRDRGCGLGKQLMLAGIDVRSAISPPIASAWKRRFMLVVFMRSWASCQSRRNSWRMAFLIF